MPCLFNFLKGVIPFLTRMTLSNTNPFAVQRETHSNDSCLQKKYVIVRRHLRFWRRNTMLWHQFIQDGNIFLFYLSYLSASKVRQMHLSKSPTPVPQYIAKNVCSDAMPEPFYYRQRN